MAETLAGRQHYVASLQHMHSLATAGILQVQWRQIHDHSCQIAQTGGQADLPLVYSFSKFYIQDACIALRNNELGLNSITHSRCKEATDNTASVCQQVFATSKPCAAAKTSCPALLLARELSTKSDWQVFHQPRPALTRCSALTLVDVRRGCTSCSPP